jgi:hydrogenase maturation protease
MRSPPDVLVLGIGNVLLGDEGVGVRAARVLGESAEAHPGSLPPGVRVMDGGTLGLDLLPHLAAAGALVVIDAVDLGLPPGSIRVLRDAAVRPPMAAARSAHDIGLVDLLETARLAAMLPAAVTLIGVQVSSMAVGLELTGAVAAAVPRAVELARCECWAMSASVGVGARARTPRSATANRLRCPACGRVEWWRGRQMVVACHDRPPRKVDRVVVPGPDEWTCACGERVADPARLSRALDRLAVSS